MHEDVPRRYDVDALRQRLPRDRAELFLGFLPWAEDCEGWRRSVRESFEETAERSLLRTVWDHPTDREARVLIDVVECPSATEALDALVDRLVWNQLSRLPEGPPELGIAAFVHPSGAPPAAAFARGNLCLSVASFGRRIVEVIPWALRLSRRLDDRPTIERQTITLTVDTEPVKVGQEVAVSYRLPWAYGEEGYLKFFATGGVLTRRRDRMIFVGSRPGDARLDAYLVERGREPHGGSLVLMIG